MTVTLRAATAWDGRPRSTALSATAPMSAARRTLGSGWTSRTNPVITVPATTTRAQRGARRIEQRPETAAAMIAKWEPDTAVMWVRLVTTRASSRAGSSIEVSPMPTPGTSPRAWPGRSRATCMKSVRTALTARVTAPGGSSTWITSSSPPVLVLETMSIADRASPGSSARRVPCTVTTAPYGASRSSAPPRTRRVTCARPRRGPGVVDHSTAVAARSSRVRPPTPPATGTADATTVPWTWTSAPSLMRTDIWPRSRTAPCPATAPAVQARTRLTRRT